MTESTTRSQASSGSSVTEPVTDLGHGFRFPLGFDPLRWLFAIVRRLYWPGGLALLLAVIGYLVGSLWNTERYSVSLQLMKKPVSSVIKTGEQGDAFRPRQLNDRSLRSTLLANETIQRTANALGIDPQALKKQVEIEQLEGTDFFYITVHSNDSPQRSLETVNLWADEIVHYTKNLQRREALAMRELLEEENHSLTQDLERINQQLLTFSSEHDFLDGDKQLESALSSLAAIQLQLEDSRILLASKNQQIASLNKELQAQSPVSGQLKKAREELAQLRGRYTDSNPLVKEKLYEIAYLEEKLADETGHTDDDLRRYTGTPLGNQLYLEIVQARNEQLQLQQRVNEYEKMVESQRKQLQNLPQKILRYSDLLQRRDQLRRAYDLLNSRLQEARIYAENAPGYWEIFQNPDQSDVNVTENRKIAVLMAGAGFVLGVGAGLLLCLVLEIRRPYRTTPLEYSIAAKCLPVLELPAGQSDDWESQLNAFWLTDLIRLQREGYLVIISIQAEPQTEARFWESLSRLAKRDELELSVLDISQKPGLPPEVVNDRATHWRNLEDWEAWAWKNLQQGPVLLRMNGDPYPAVLPVLEKSGYWLYLLDESVAPKALKKQVRLFSNTLPSPDGLILIRDTPPNTVAQALESGGLLIGKLFTKKPASTANA